MSGIQKVRILMSKQEKIVCAALRVTWTGVLNLEHDMVLCGPHYEFIRRNGLYMNLKYGEFQETVNHEKGFITNKNRFVDPVEAMGIAVKAEQVGGILWKKVEARMLNDCGFIDRSKVKGKAIDETIKSYLEFPLKPEDLY